MRIVTNYELVRQIATSDAFGAYSMADSYRELGHRLGADFGPTIALLDQLPTFMDGEAHRLARKTQAQRGTAHKQAQLDAAQSFLDQFAATALLPGTGFDLFADFARPLFRAISAAMVPDAWREGPWLDLMDDVPLLFSSSTSLKRRFAINRGLGALAEAHGPESWTQIVLLVLGNRPLSGSIALSLHDIFTRHAGQALNSFPWPAYFTQSALHYFDRICLRAIAFGDDTFAEGERIRCHIHAPEWSGAERQSTMFGVGAHLCLGRPLSELMWSMTTAMFARQECRVTPSPLTFRLDAEPFHLPTHCAVSIAA